MLIEKTIKEHNLFFGVKKLGVAVSGGSDSMCLLYYLKNYTDVPIVVLNVEHGIRGEASRRDSEFVAEFCKKNNIEFVARRCDCLLGSKLEGENLEQNARKARYEFFLDFIKSGRADKVATAHNLCDNAESVLLNLVRGSGMQGVCGIEYETAGGIIRPLLDTNKDCILQFISRHSIPFVEDETNADLSYSRNFMRRVIAPNLQKLNPKALQHIVRFSNLISKDEQFLQEAAAKYVNQNTVDVKAFESAPLGYRAIKQALLAIGQSADVFQPHVESVFSLKQNGKVICLPNDVRACLEYGKVRFYRQEQRLKSAAPFQKGTFDFDGHQITIRKTDCKGEGFFIRDCKELEHAEIRYCKEGDVFKSCNGYTKKLNKFFTDKKIPKEQRNRMPLLCLKNEVIAVFNVEISDRFKVETTENMLSLKCETIGGEHVRRY